MPDLSAQRATPHFVLRDHPLRVGLSAEMHGRKLPPIEAPTRFIQVVLAVPDHHAAEERVALQRLAAPRESIDEGTRFWCGQLGDIHYVWERHTEFSSYMFICPGMVDDPFDDQIFDTIPRNWFEGLPGDVIRATRGAVVSEGLPGFVETTFLQEDIVHCALMGDLASLWSDFRLHADGFGRLLIVDHGMTSIETALCIQRVQELGNYRNLALLGLPVAQQWSPTLNVLEQRLSATTQRIADRTVADEILLGELTDLSGEVARIVADTHYRMSASKAYAEIVEDRMRALRTARIAGHPTLADFTERRLLPAVRTCMSFSARIEVLSQRVAWTSGLLRTRVDTELARHNRDLLRSMNQRTDLQLRLQHAVEKLSVVAISYYAVGLFDHVLAGFIVSEDSHRATVVGILAIAIPILLWLSLGRIRHKFLSEELLDEAGDTSLNSRGASQ